MRLTLALLILPGFIAASIAQPSLTIRGKMNDLQSNKVYLFFVNSALSDTTLVDSVTVNQQQFSFKQSIQEPKQAFIMFKNHSEKVAFLWDNNIEINLNNSLSNTSSIINSVATTEWYDFLAGIDSIPKSIDADCHITGPVISRGQNFEGIINLRSDSKLYSITYAVPNTIDTQKVGYVCNMPEKFKKNGLHVRFSGDYYHAFKDFQKTHAGEIVMYLYLTSIEPAK